MIDVVRGYTLISPALAHVPATGCDQQADIANVEAQSAAVNAGRRVKRNG